MKYAGFVIVLLIAAVVIVLARKGQKKNDAAMQQYASSHGYTFDKKPDKSVVFDLDIFTRPHSLGVRDLLTSSNGRSYVTVFAAESNSSNMQHNASSNSFDTQYTASITNTSQQSTYFNLIPKGLSGMFIFKGNGLSKYNLEGQLSELYELHINPGSENEALSMLTPDTLLYLAANFQTTAVIARPNKLYVFYRKTYSYKAQPGTEFSADAVFGQLNSVTDKLLKISAQQTATSVAQTPTPTDQTNVIVGN